MSEIKRRNMIPIEGELITLKELAARWGLKYNTVRNYAVNSPHLLPPIHKVIGIEKSPIYFSIKEVEEFEGKSSNREEKRNV